MAEFPPVPLTIEGSSVLHQMFSFDWKAWRSISPPERHRIVEESVRTLQEIERGTSSGGPARSAMYSLLGHKGDLMLIHFRDTIRSLNQAELKLAQCEFYNFLTLKYSYLSVVELGLYESSMKTYGALIADGTQEHTARSSHRHFDSNLVLAVYVTHFAGINQAEINQVYWNLRIVNSP